MDLIAELQKIRMQFSLRASEVRGIEAEKTILEVQELFGQLFNKIKESSLNDLYWIHKSAPTESPISQPSELLPCPFCGGESNGFHRRKNGEDAYMVSCLNCGIDTPKLKTQELARELWNKRASQRAKD